MSYVKPLAMAAALALSLIGMDAVAGTHPADITIPTTTKQALPANSFFIAEEGTANAHKVYYFSKLDRNGDKQLSRSEVPTDMWRLRAYFVYADFNHNGRVSLEEYYMWKKHLAPEYTTVFHIPTFVYMYRIP